MKKNLQTFVHHVLNRSFLFCFATSQPVRSNKTCPVMHMAKSH